MFGAISANANPSYWPHDALPGSTSGLYGYSSGTSFSSPEVAGAAALVWAANPELSATDVAAVLKETAAGNAGAWNPNTGLGRLDAAAAVARAQALLTGPPAVTLAGTRNGTHIDLSWSAPGATTYKLTVSRDGGLARMLQGATIETRASYNLELGHTYSFSLAAMEALCDSSAGVSSGRASSCSTVCSSPSWRFSCSKLMRSSPAFRAPGGNGEARLRAGSRAPWERSRA